VNEQTLSIPALPESGAEVGTPCGGRPGHGVRAALRLAVSSWSEASGNHGAELQEVHPDPVDEPSTCAPEEHHQGQLRAWSVTGATLSIPEAGIPGRFGCRPKVKTGGIFTVVSLPVTQHSPPLLSAEPAETIRRRIALCVLMHSDSCRTSMRGSSTNHRQVTQPPYDQRHCPCRRKIRTHGGAETPASPRR
jgi:hypothetical protein